MMTVQIIADSACDLSMEDFKTYDITRVSLSVLLDGTTYKDGETIEAKTIYDEMRNGKTPKTSQVTPQDFEEVFSAFAKENKPCLYVGFSSALSGTYQAATIALQQVKEDYPDAQIQLIDTRCASLGFGLVVKEAARLSKEGLSLEEIAARAKYQAEHMEHIFTVDDLEYLYRGGRVSKTAAFMGTLLKIKPILHVEEGKLVPLEKMRGTKKAYQRMLDIIEERGKDLENQVVGISHGDSLEVAETLAKEIKERFKVKEVVIRMVGSVVGAHSGPGTIAIFFSNATSE